MPVVDETVEWMCGVCRYVYMAQTGDAKGNIAQGTPFEDLPDDWVCPQCESGKEVFEKA